MPEVVRRTGSAQGVLVLFLVDTAAGLALYGLRYPMFDRYLWPMIPVLSSLMLHLPEDLAERSVIHPGGGRDLWFAGAASAAGAVIAAMSLLFLLNSHAFDVGRWRAGEALMRLGIASGEIDAGYEWRGYHATAEATASSPTNGPRSNRNLWPSFRMCGLVSSTPQSIANGELVGTAQYQLNLVSGPTETLYLYRFTRPECTPQ